MKLTVGQLRQLIAEAKWNVIRKTSESEPLSYTIHGWHATLTDRWQSIQKQGLVPGKAGPAGQDWLGDYSGRAIYYHQAFPYHELSNSFDESDDEPATLLIEVQFSIHAGYVVPDEEFGTPEMTQQIMNEKSPIAVAFPAKPDTFLKIHLVDSPGARTWAKTNVKNLPVEFHDISSLV